MKIVTILTAITVHANLLYMQFPYIFEHKIKRTRIPIPILSRVP